MHERPYASPAWLLLGAIITVASIEFLQNGMLNFASAYIMGGVGATPEEYSLSAMAYASAAIPCLFMHTWMVERLGYRNFVLLSILAFACGGLICGGSESVGAFILGRAVQGLGGATFLTAGRLLVNRRQGMAKNIALVLFGYALMGGSTLGPLLGAWFLRHAQWRWLFWGMLPLLILPSLLALFAFDDKPVDVEDESHHHPVALGLLVLCVFFLQSALQKTPYDFFGRPELVALPFLVALTAGVFFVLKHRSTTTDQARWKSLATWSYLSGLVMYFLCYFILAANSFILPVLVQQGLGFDIPTSAALLSATFLGGMIFGVLFVALYFTLFAKFGINLSLLLASLALALFGHLMQGLSPAATFPQVARILLVNGFFLVFFISPAAQRTFRQVDSDDFSHAYQSKNIARQLALSMAVAFSAIFLQWRNALHTSRIGEHLSRFSLNYQQATATFQARMPVRDSRLLDLMLVRQVRQQSSLISCLDFYWLLQWAGMGLAALLLLRIVFVDRKTDAKPLPGPALAPPED